MTSIVKRIYRYPVKGLSADSITEVNLSPGQAVPHDRRFAILSTGKPPFDRATDWQPKSNFLALVNQERLAALNTTYDEASERLVIYRGTAKIVEGQLTSRIGRAVIEEFFSAYVGSGSRDQPSVVFASDNAQTLSDSNAPLISIINQKTVNDLERVIGNPIDPLRFRGNLLVELSKPWQEVNWVGRTISIGNTDLIVESQIERCGATNVNPTLGKKDLNIPKALKLGFGHTDCGVYARVVKAGKICIGDIINTF